VDYSECVDGKRKAFFFFTADCKIDHKNQPLPHPIFDISCTDPCLEGEQLEINPLTRELFCGKCPNNTYSPGSGIKLIDGKNGDWGV
jgi:hypothetical protein